MFLREALRGVDYNSLQAHIIEIKKDIFTDFRNKAKILVIIDIFTSSVVKKYVTIVNS